MPCSPHLTMNLQNVQERRGSRSNVSEVRATDRKAALQPLAGLVTRFRSRTERRTNLFSRRTLYVLVVACFALAVASPAVAGKGGGKGANASVAPCSVADNTVHADGLPTDQVVNFMVTDSSGTSGWVLGFTDDGSWSVPVSSPNGPTTYEFVSRTWGPGGSHYTTFATCSA